MNKYIDIHSHILPGIDDGPENMQQSLAMLRIAKEEGIGSIIVTPHYKSERHSANRETIINSISELQQKSDAEKYGITIYAGNELYYRSNLKELLEAGCMCTLASSSYILVEFSPMDDYAYIRNGLYHILSEGYRPVIAHIERYRCMLRKQELVYELIGMGCYVQVNAGSIIGSFGYITKKYTLQLLKKGFVHFVATDAHNDKKRAPLMKKCARKLYRRFDKDYVDALLFKNAEKIITNEYILFWGTV